MYKFRIINLVLTEADLLAERKAKDEAAAFMRKYGQAKRRKTDYR